MFLLGIFLLIFLEILEQEMDSDYLRILERGKRVITFIVLMKLQEGVKDGFFLFLTQ